MIDVLFVHRVNELSGQTIQLCYHCHKCTSGCPVADEMVYGPDRVLHLVQLGDAERLLTSHDIWICASCETCGTRCPNEIDIARVMDALCQIAVVEGVAIAEPDALTFHRLFLLLIKRMGRMHEATLLSLYMMWTRSARGVVGTGTKMLAKGKLPLIPRPVKARREMQRLFEEAKE